MIDAVPYIDHYHIEVPRRRPLDSENSYEEANLGDRTLAWHWPMRHFVPILDVAEHVGEQLNAKGYRKEPKI